MEEYFSKFPTVYWNKVLCKDITRRVIIEKKGRNGVHKFHPFSIQDELRPDHIAEFYYNDAYLDWMVYMANDIIDPFYGWYLNNQHFEKLLIEKYGSVELAQKKVIYYRNNWYDDTKEISKQDYDSIISPSWKKYYTPNYGAKTNIISYKRKEENITMNTNRILKYTISYNTGNAYTSGEVVDFKYSGAIVGTAEVDSCNSTVVIVKNVAGNTTANSTHNIIILGETSATNATANAVATVHENIPLSEEVFWSPVTFFDEEYLINENKKDISLVVDQIAGLVSQEVEKKINQDL